MPGEPIPSNAGWASGRKPAYHWCRNLGCSDSKLANASLPEIFGGSVQNNMLGVQLLALLTGEGT